MIDGAGRNITYLRLSVTDLCDLRCRYCMAEEGVEKRPHGALCSFEELQSFAAAAARLGVSLTGVKHLLVTHPHPDHLSVEPLAWREEMNHAVSLPEQTRIAAVSPRFTPLPVMTVYGNAFVKETLLGARPELFDGSHPTQLRFQEIHEGERVETENLAFTPVRAVHGKPGFAHSYIIERGGKTLLYALDAGGY